MRFFLKFLIIICIANSEANGQGSWSLNGGIAYYDFLYRPIVNLKNGQTFKLTKSSQDFMHIGYLFGVSYKYRINSLFDFEVGSELEDRRRLIHAAPIFVPNTESILYTNFQYYSIYLDFPLQITLHLNSNISIFSGGGPSIILKKYFYRGQELITSRILPQAQKYNFDMSLLTGFNYNLDKEQTFSIIAFYAPPKSIGVFDRKKYGLGGVQIKYSHTLNKVHK